MATSQEAYRKAMARFATGVTVITTRLGDRLHGMTANAVASVSLDPPTLLVVVGTANATHDLIPKTGRFTVNVLAAHQAEISARFAEKDPDRDPFQDLPYDLDAGGQPFLPGALARLRCALVAAHPAGDHTIFVGEVEELAVHPGKPLLYFESAYRTLPHSGSSLPGGPGDTESEAWAAPDGGSRTSSHLSP